jgi:hypothetical protein
MVLFAAVDLAAEALRRKKEELRFDSSHNCTVRRMM